VSSQHRHTNRNYRPADDEYEPVKDAVANAGFTMNTLLRAFLRWLRQDPTRLKQFVPLMRDVDNETPRGRPKKKAPQA
jgi:GrpB-like predicted nucleotidyltransferase (UPF0157 family)